MKNTLIGIAVGAVIAAAVSVPLTWYLSRGEDVPGGTVEQEEPGPTSPTSWTDNTPAGKYCGDTIDITGTMRDNDFFVACRDNCKGNSRTFPMRAKCPQTYRPYGVMAQAHILGGYNSEIGKFDAIAGGTLTWLWNMPRGSAGIGATYLRSLVIDSWYAGASATAILDFGKLKIKGE